MLIDKKINELQNLTKRKITNIEIAKILGLGSGQAVINRINRKQQLKEYEILKLNDAFKNEINKINHIKTELIPQEDIQTVELDYYPDLDYSCGNGLIPFGYTKEKKKVPVSVINGYSEHKRYVIVNAKSDSMMPEIKPNDLLIIRVIDAEPIIDNHIYVFCHDEHLYCKYLSYNIGQIIVRSANKDYPTRYIEGENLETFKLHGEVCGLMRDLR